MQFLDKFIPKKNLIRPQVCAVEIVFSDEETRFYYTWLKNSKGKLEVVQTGNFTNDLKLPAAIQKSKIPVVLVLSGSGTIVKKVIADAAGGHNIETIISEHLPAIDSQDFAIQFYTQENGVCYLALCRNELLEKELSRLKESKAEVAAAFIGPPVLTGLQPVWNNFNGIQAGNYFAELQNNFLENIYEKEPEQNTTLNMEGLVLNTVYVKAFAAGLNYMLQQFNVLTNHTTLSVMRQWHTEKNKFRALAITAIAAAFTLTLLNVILFSHYFDVNNRYEKELLVYQGKYEEINILLTNYEKKKTLFENTGLLDKNRLSEYADKIIETVPEEVILSELHFNPAKSNDEHPDSLLAFKDKTLLIKGNCNKSLVINDWVNNLKALPFVKEVRLEKFLYTSEGLLPNYEITLLAK